MEFGITVDDIGTLIQDRNVEDLTKVGGLKQLEKDLKTDLKTGLSEENEGSLFAERIEVFSDNTYPEPPHETFLQLFLGAWSDTAVIILTIAAIVSLIVGIVEYVSTPEGEEKEPSWIEGLAVFMAVLIVALVSSINNYSKDKQFRKLSKEEGKIEVSVIRDGELKQILISHVMVGDVISLKTGGQIPADGIYIDGFDLYLDESAMTGEPIDVRKSDESPFLLSGCKVSRGVGKMLAIAVGVNSEWGKTLAGLTKPAEETPLQEKLEKLVVLIGKIGSGVAGAVFIILVIYWIIDIFVEKKHGDQVNVASFQGLLHALIIAITVIVVAVPEGLPLAVTISLAYSMGQMMKDNNLVRHLSACETMGGATNICSDKTGTLTENRMTVLRGVVAGVEFKGKDDIPKLNKKLNSDLCDLFGEGLSLNSDANLKKKEDGTIEFVGSKTEGALLVFADKLGYDYNKIRAEHTIHRLFAFSSARKRMSIMVPVPEPDKKKKKKLEKLGKEFVDEEQDYRLHIKGAPEILLEYCTHIVNQNFEVREITKDDVDFHLKKVEEFATKGFRTLGIGYKEFHGGKAWPIDKPQRVEKDVIFIGVLGIEDPPRPGVKEAVITCQTAGIFVRMVTGDNILTAKKIAEDICILTDGGLAMEGPDFRKLGPKELDDILPRLQVLARSSPTDKYILVKRLRTNGEVVAVTGDGTNDAPALKEADVGLSMGKCGTEVAKQASDIVILDDNFTSIVQSVKWGRSVFDNIKKFLQFQLTVNIVALLTAFASAVFRFGTPLTAVQLLWVNLIMDTMAALAFSTEKPTDLLLKRRPYGRQGGLLTKIMYRNIIATSIYQFGVLMVLLFLFDSNGNHLLISGADNGQLYDKHPNIHYTVIFNTFVFLQIFNEFNSRKCDRSYNVFDGLFKNYIFCSIIGVTLLVQFLVVQFTGLFTKCAPLNFNQWMLSVTLGFILLPYGALIRAVTTPYIPKETWEIPADPNNIFERTKK
jgi:Ca2+-transporting ATPase